MIVVALYRKKAATLDVFAGRQLIFIGFVPMMGK
jgi:hypothetical protein